jgi:fucose permease
MGTEAIALNPPSRQRYLFVLLCFGFLMTGLEITLIGPLMPQFIARWSLNDAQVAVFFPVEFGCSLAGVWLASLLTHYLGTRVPVIAGYFLMATGLTLVNASSMTIVLFALAALGLAYGLVVPGTNLTVAEIGGARSASLVSLVNFAWGAGALSCSPLVTLALKTHALPQMLFASAAFTLLLTLSFFFADFPGTKHESTESGAVPAPTVSVANTAALAALFFLYVGVEVSLGSWATVYTKRLVTSGEGLATVAPGFFYGGLMTGRAVAPAVLARIREYPLVLSVLFLALSATTVVLLARNQPTAFVALVFAGLGCATVFPIYIAWLSRWYGRDANRISGLMFSMSSLGSAAAPWFVGVMSAHAGDNLRIGLLVPLVSVIGMLALLLIVRRQAAT